MTAGGARSHPNRLFVYALIGLMQVFWTANFLIGKVALREFPAPLLAGLRVLIAALCILPFYAWRAHGRGHWTRRDLPTLTTPEELHTANALTQTTQWATLTAGTLLAGGVVTRFGCSRAFIFNSLSFLVSAWAVSGVRPKREGFKARRALTEADVVRPWHESMEGLRYMRSVPLVLGIALAGVGWATGGGAAQILFSVFGGLVFNRGPAGIGAIWGFAGIGSRYYSPRTIGAIAGVLSASTGLFWAWAHFTGTLPAPAPSRTPTDRWSAVRRRSSRAKSSPCT